MKKKSLIGLLALAVLGVGLVVAQANYQGWKDVGGALVTYNKLCLEGTAGAGQDFCMSRGTAGHLTFLTGAAAANPDIMGTGASPLTVTFKAAYTAAPVCIASDQSGTPAAVQVAPTTTNVVFTGTAAHTIAYVCFGS